MKEMFEASVDGEAYDADRWSHTSVQVACKHVQVIQLKRQVQVQQL